MEYIGEEEPSLVDFMCTKVRLFRRSLAVCSCLPLNCGGSWRTLREVLGGGGGVVVSIMCNDALIWLEKSSRNYMTIFPVTVQHDLHFSFLSKLYYHLFEERCTPA